MDDCKDWKGKFCPTKLSPMPMRLIPSLNGGIRCRSKQTQNEIHYYLEFPADNQATNYILHSAQLALTIPLWTTEVGITAQLFQQWAPFPNSTTTIWNLDILELHLRCPESSALLGICTYIHVKQWTIKHFLLWCTLYGSSQSCQAMSHTWTDSRGSTNF